MSDNGGLTDAQFSEQEDRVSDLFAKWKDALGLRYWELKLNFFRGDIPDDEEAMMACYPDWKYLRARVKVNCESVSEEKDEAKLEWTVVHELMHVFVHELQPDPQTDDYLDHEERVASMLATAIIMVRDAALAPLIAVE